MKLRTFTLLCILFFLNNAALAASDSPPPKRRVHIMRSSDDSVFNRFVLVLKERIAKSALFEAADSCSDIVVLCVRIVSFDLEGKNQANSGEHSAAAVSYTKNNCTFPVVYSEKDNAFSAASELSCANEALSLTLLRVGEKQINSMADDMLADILKLHEKHFY